jgi:ATP-dependent DNA helicase RecG
MRGFFDTPIEYLKGVGPQRAALLNKELNIFTFGDLLQHYPHRYEDRTRFFSIKEMNEEMTQVQLKGKITNKDLVGTGFKKRLVADFRDETGEVELIWFQGVNWINDKIKTGVEYVVFGKPSKYGKKYSLAHPEIEVLTVQNEKDAKLHPVYPLTEKLRARHIDSKTLSKLIQDLFDPRER